MSYFTSAIASIVVFTATVATATTAIATPTAGDKLVSSYTNPSASTQKVEKTMAKIQSLLEIKCYNVNPRIQGKCDSKKFANPILTAIRKSGNLRVTIANLSGVKTTAVNKAQLAELTIYQEVLQFQAGKNGTMSQTAQALLPTFDLEVVN